MSNLTFPFYPELNPHFGATTVFRSPLKRVRMRVAFFLFILFMAIQTCAYVAVREFKDKLDGRWEWVMTFGGDGGEIFTPQSEQYSLTLVFSKNVSQPESDSIGYEVYRNDTLIHSGITTVTLSSMQPFGPYNRIKGLLNSISDTLQIGTSVADGYSSYFVKVTTTLRREQPFAHATVPLLPSNHSSYQFTLSGRRIHTTRDCMLSLQVIISRQHTEVAGIRKK